MLEKLKKMSETLTESMNRGTINPAQFEDPLAESIGWTPVKGGGSNFRTHTFFEESHNRVGFKATPGAKLFSGLFMLVGLGVAVGISWSELQNGTPLFDVQMLFPIIFGLIFFGAGFFMYRSFAKPVIFDKLVGYYWKGWKAPERYSGTEPPKNAVRLDDIYAIQLLSEYIRGDKRSYYSYELNLVTKDGNRLNVVDHGKKGHLIQDANKLSKFLDKPIWNAS